MFYGIDRLLTENFGLSGRLGLITNPTGVSKNFVSSIDILKERFDLRALFAPEHGVRGDVDAGGKVSSYTDARTGLPVYSVYGSESANDNRPSQDVLANLDALLFDIQDVGSRFYTYISTMYNAMEACAEAGKTFVVLDRPNPINGAVVEGNILEPAFKSFVGIAPITVRHGLTMGELALFFNKECCINCKLEVVQLEGWERGQFGDEAGIAWINPSPNIPSIEAALLYPGTCFFEGTNISEGRGTTRPFEQIGAPWLDADALACGMNEKKLPGVVFLPAFFQPFTSKFSGAYCRGVQIHITDRKKLRAVETSLKLLEAVRAQNPEKFEWRKFNESYSIDRLSGTNVLREKGTDAYFTLCEKGAALFYEKRKAYLLY